MYMSFFSALYMLQNVLIVNISCNFVINIQKKKKNDPYFGMGKNAKVMPQMLCYLSFLLGKGGNPYTSNPIKAIIASALSDLISPACTKLDKASMTHFKIAQNA